MVSSISFSEMQYQYYVGHRSSIQQREQSKILKWQLHGGKWCHWLEQLRIWSTSFISIPVSRWEVLLVSCASLQSRGTVKRHCEISTWNRNGSFWCLELRSWRIVPLNIYTSFPSPNMATQLCALIQVGRMFPLVQKQPEKLCQQVMGWQLCCLQGTAPRTGQLHVDENPDAGGRVKKSVLLWLTAAGNKAFKAPSES